MNRHPLDRPQPDDSTARAAAFVRIARAEQPHPASRALQRQPRGDRQQTLTQALRVARGHTA